MSTDNFATETIILNSSNFNGSNGFTYTFPAPVNLTGATLNLVSVDFFSQFFNITAAYQNQTYSVKWIDGTVYNYTIPAGYYEIAQLNANLEYNLFSSGLYWYDANKNVVYPVVISLNQSTYQCTISCLNVPTSSQASSLGLFLPASVNSLYTGSFTAWPATSTTPQIILSAGLGRNLGFNANATYTFPSTPLTNVVYSASSDSTPIQSPLYSVILTCSVFNNHLGGANNQILQQIPLGSATFGSLIQWQSPYKRDLSVADGVFKQLTISLWDNSMNSLAGQIRDNEFTIILDITFNMNASTRKK